MGLFDDLIPKPAIKRGGRVGYVDHRTSSIRLGPPGVQNPLERERDHGGKAYAQGGLVDDDDQTRSSDQMTEEQARKAILDVYGGDEQKAGIFDDLIPKTQQTPGLFDDLIPQKPDLAGSFLRGAYAPFKPIVDAIPQGVEASIRGGANLESAILAPFLSEEDRQALQKQGLYTPGESPVKEFSQAAYSGLFSPLSPALEAVAGGAKAAAKQAGVPDKVTSGAGDVVNTALDVLGVAGVGGGHETGAPEAAAADPGAQAAPAEQPAPGTQPAQAAPEQKAPAAERPAPASIPKEQRLYVRPSDTKDSFQLVDADGDRIVGGFDSREEAMEARDEMREGRVTDEPPAWSAAPKEEGLFDDLIPQQPKTEAAAEVDKAAAQVNTAPTQGQKEAGNYQKGHVNIQGLDITIENPRGSTRSGVDADGNPWSVQMPDTYGYIKNTEGMDGEHVDAYIGPNPESKKAFIVDQIDADTGAPDEHKVMLGYDDINQATAQYEKAFSDGRGSQRIGGISSTDIDGLKKWLKANATKKPAAEAPRTPATGEAPAQTAPASFSAPGIKYPVQDFLKKSGGVEIGSTLAGELQHMGVTPRTAPGLFKAKGNGGLRDVDNVPASEWKVSEAPPQDGNGYVDRQFILDAIASERAGKPITGTPEAAAPIAHLNQEFAEHAQHYPQAPAGMHEAARDLVLQKSAEDGNEHAVIVDANSGSVAHVHTDGKKSYVSIPPEAIDDAINPDANLTFIHSHPDESEAPVSPEDLQNLVRVPGVKRAEAHTKTTSSAVSLSPEYRKRLTKLDASAADAKLQRALEKAWDTSGTLAMFARNRGEITPHEANVLWHEAANRGLAKAGITRYESVSPVADAHPELTERMASSVAAALKNIGESY
jgi:hypothetical protein